MNFEIKIDLVFQQGKKIKAHEREITLEGFIRVF
jgi:hypothetical protein